MKKALLTFAIVASAMFAKAENSYLYWMLNSMPTGSYSEYYAAVKTSEGTYLNFGNSSYDMVVAETGTRYYNLIGANPEQYSYIIELWNEDGAEAAFSTGVMSYSDLSQYITSTGHMSIMGLNAGDFHSVPEPTSGMMVLMGAMLLGLKRKRKLA